ncbi:MAG: HD domain-containing protein [Thermomicrobiales bacterium]
MSTYPDLNGKTRDDAWALLTEWVSSESLRKHCLSVEAAMRWYARQAGEPEDAWAMVGLLHDFDYERHPTLQQHPIEGAPVLRDAGYPEWIIRAILSHGDLEETFPRQSQLEKTLHAVDELTGFVSAVALVRPSKAVADVKPSSVRKKMKDKAFAAAINRSEMVEAAALLGVEFDVHVASVIDAMTENAEALGLQGVPVSPSS